LVIFLIFFSNIDIIADAMSIYKPSNE